MRDLKTSRVFITYLAFTACGGEQEAVFVAIPWAPESTVVFAGFHGEERRPASEPARILLPGDPVDLHGFKLEDTTTFVSLEYREHSRAARGLAACGLGGAATHAKVPLSDHAYEYTVASDRLAARSFVSTDPAAAWRPNYGTCDGTACDGLRSESVLISGYADVSRVKLLASGTGEIALVFNAESDQLGHVLLFEYPDRLLWAHSSTGAGYVGAALLGDTLFVSALDGSYLEIDVTSQTYDAYSGILRGSLLSAHPDGFVLSYSESSTSGFELRPGGVRQRSNIVMPGPREDFAFGPSGQMAAWSEETLYTLEESGWRSWFIGTGGNDIDSAQWIEDEFYVLTARHLQRRVGDELVLEYSQTLYQQRSFLPWLDGFLVGGTVGSLIHIAFDGVLCDVEDPTTQTLSSLVEARPGLAASFVLTTGDSSQPLVVWLVDETRLIKAR